MVRFSARLCFRIEVNMPTEATESLKLLFGKREAAGALSISRRKIDYLISSKVLRATRIGRRTLIHRRELERLARQGTA